MISRNDSQYPKYNFNFLLSQNKAEKDVPSFREAKYCDQWVRHALIWNTNMAADLLIISSDKRH
jgi:hypothetical protein